MRRILWVSILILIVHGVASASDSPDFHCSRGDRLKLAKNISQRIGRGMPNMTSVEIDRRVREAVQDGEGLESCRGEGDALIASSCGEALCREWFEDSDDDYDACIRYLGPKRWIDFQCPSGKQLNPCYQANYTAFISEIARTLNAQIKERIKDVKATGKGAKKDEVALIQSIKDVGMIDRAARHSSEFGFSYKVAAPISSVDDMERMCERWCRVNGNRQWFHSGSDAVGLSDVAKIDEASSMLLGNFMGRCRKMCRSVPEVEGVCGDEGAEEPSELKADTSE